jgi:hypothetical protein
VLSGLGLGGTGAAAGLGTAGTAVGGVLWPAVAIAGVAAGGYYAGNWAAQYTTVPLADWLTSMYYADQNRLHQQCLPPPTPSTGTWGMCGTSYQQALCQANCNAFGQSSSNCQNCQACLPYGRTMQEASAQCEVML